MAFPIEFQTLKMSVEGKIWTLEVNRPEALNALNTTVLHEMADALRVVGEMDYEHARCLVVTGSGDRAFVAGADIKEMAGLDREQGLAFAGRGQHLFLELSLMRIPVIAAVNGFALGGGLELALACDFIIASEKAKFGLPEVGLGLMPGFGGTVNLATAVGLRRAKEMTYTGKVINAQEALSIGLINSLVPADQLRAEVMKVANMIAEKSPIGVTKSKQSINEAYFLETESALKIEANHFSDLFSTTDMREGTRAFMEKRKPKFLGE